MHGQNFPSLKELRRGLLRHRIRRPSASRGTRFVLLGLSLIFAVPSAALAQNDGAILLFSDPDYTSCSVVDVADEEYTVYVVHVDYDGVTGSTFLILNTSELVYGGEDIPWPAIGNTQNGLAVDYQTCHEGEVLVGTITYLGSGISSACSDLSVLPVPLGSGDVDAINCADLKVVPYRGELVVNADATCPCEPIVPVEESSWGRIKALYE